MTDDSITTRRTFAMPDGIDLVADVGGPADAPVVVFMHGGGQTRHSWAKALPAVIAAGYRVINYDARGHGDSGWSPDGRYSLPLRAADLAVILDGVEAPVALVGASMGGVTALQMIGKDLLPRPSALVILAFMAAHRDGFATIEEAAEAVSAYNPHRPRPSNPAGLARNLRLREDGRYHWHWDPRMLDARARAPEPGAPNETLIDHASKIRVPTLLVRGMASDVVTDESVREFQDICPTLEVFNVEGAGHMVVGDSNAIFNAGILDFLQRHMPARG
jgi:pimeloyl-ACP methyl ester carboxylesterase